MMSMTRPCDIKTDAMTSAFAHYHQEIIHFKRLQNFRKCIFFVQSIIFIQDS